MKALLNKILLISCFWITACISQSENRTDQTPSMSNPSAEQVALESMPAVNIDRYLSAMESQGFSGAILVSENDEVILRKGYGFADREKRRRYTPETIQTNGSITKQFTGAAILLLESEGKLSVNDHISAYLDPISDEMANITIHQLLTHSSGMPGGIGPDHEPIGADAYLERLLGESLQFEPGTGYAYSNTGYSLLGMIVEEVSGQVYESFLREKLLIPAGLKETGYFLPEWDRDRLAIGYRNGERWGEIFEKRYMTAQVDSGPSWHSRANGGLLTTVDDMYTWLHTVKGDGVLDEEIARRWTTGYVTESNGYSEYGYGWGSYQHDKWGRVITHSGSNRIFEADFVWLPEREFFFYIQGNTSMVPAASLGGRILNAAFDSTFSMPPLIDAGDSADPDPERAAERAAERAGEYDLDNDAGKIELTADDTRLVAKLTGQSVLDLMVNHPDDLKATFAELNSRTRIAMDKVREGQPDALSGLTGEETDARAATAPILRRIEQIGGLDSLHVIGTFENHPGSSLYQAGPWTTFVYAEFENWNQYWNLVWNSDETIAADLQGPWPTFTLIPVGEDQYTGVSQQPPYHTIPIHFSGNCLEMGSSSLCREVSIE